MDSIEVVAGANAQASEYNNLRKDLVLGKYGQGAETIPSGAPFNVTIDWTDKTKGKVRNINFGANNLTAIFSGAVKDQVLTFIITQDATGGRTLAWPANIKWPGGQAPVLSTAANRVDIVQVMCVQDTPSAAYIGLYSSFGNY